MKITGLLLVLTTLYFVLLTRSVTSLRPGGRNVLTRYVSTNTRLKKSVLTRTGRTTRSCTYICTWRCCRCRRCSYRTVYYQKYKDVYYYVRQYKPIYFCAFGWRANGDECTIPICTGGCANNGVCTSPERCKCQPGWRGPKCRSDVKECLTNNGGCQHNCTNSLGSYSCFCNSGYNQSQSNFSRCQDIDECSEGTHNCSQRCVNQPGSYSCACHVGYRLDNNSRTCSDIDECSQVTCEHKCNNTAGSFFCTCPQGYLLTTNGRDCADHDECMTGNHTCGRRQRCVNHPGSYSCACLSGFLLTKDNQTCSDIDECQSGIAGCSQKCNNMIGSFQCSCQTGYFLNPDNRTCTDLDECRNGQHTCSQICGNTQGSYYCACRPGYYLDADLRTCKGYPCLSISNPANGNMNCTGNTMDSVCQFSCYPGYELAGSQLRMCLSNGYWSGGRAVCKIKHCNQPTPPVNGFIQIPCWTAYKGKCSFGCHSGYFLNGSRTVSCSEDSKWISIPGQCEAITICQPNPCFNGGVCHPHNSNNFWCNCTNTGYMGSKCHVGIVRTPKYPRLQENNSVNVTFQLSPPKNKLIITPRATGLDFYPRDLVIAPTQLKKGRLYVANMTVTARISGIKTVIYTLSGITAKSYQVVLPDTVIVLDNSTSCNDSLSTSLPVGCYKVRLFKCPKSAAFLYAVSTELWKRFGGKVTTKGVASIVSGNLTLPLGIQGANFDKINHSSVTTDTKQCKADRLKRVQCLSTEILASVFLQSLNNSFPSWFRLIPSKTLSGLEPNDVNTFIWTGTELKGILRGLGLSVNDKSFYSVLMYTHAITVKANGSSVDLPKYGKKSFLLAAAELCSEVLPAKVLIAFNPLSYAALQEMPLYRQLAAQGWNVSALALQFARQSALSYSVSTWNQSNTIIPGNLELYGRVEKSFHGSHPIHSLQVLYVGNIITEIPNNDKAWVNNPISWTAGVRGKVNVTVGIRLLQQQLSLDIALDRCSGEVQYQDYEKINSCKFQDTYTLFLNGLLRNDPFTSNLLGSFIESANSNIHFFANAHNPHSSSQKPSKSALHLGFHLRGTVKFGPLKFPNLTISANIYSEDFKRCDANSNFQVLKLFATFNQRKGLGQFFTFSDSDSVQILLHSNHQNKNNGTFNTTVALLGDTFQAQVAISNTSISFRREFLLFDTYRLNVSGSSTLQPWDFLLLKLSGVFGANDTLESSLKKMIKNYITVVVDKTYNRLRSLQYSDDKVKVRVDKSKFRLAQAENDTQLAVIRYLWLLKAKQAALKEVNSTEKNVANSSQEVDQLKTALERLCSVTECPYVCVSGTVCNTCYKDLISKEQGLCPGTCHNILKERIPPYQEMSTCLKEECDHSGSQNMLGFVTCNFEEFGKSIVKTAVKTAITAAATYALAQISVPAIVALPIATAAVTYADTKNPVIAVAAAGASMFNSGPFGVFKDIVAPSTVTDYGRCDEEGGKWECSDKPYPCVKNLYKYKFTNIPYSCKIPCQVNVIKETIATPCCKEVNCASRMKDLKCKEKNAFCRIAREKALSKLNTAKRNLIKPFVQLQKAKKKLRVVEIELAKQTIELEAASSKRNILRRAHNALLKAANISQRANDQNRALIKDAMALAQLWNITNQTCPVDIKKISFDVTLSSPSETKIPVMFEITSKNRETAIFPVVNFASLNESLKQIAKQIVKELFGNVSVVLRSGHPLNQMASAQSKGNNRRKRSIDEGNADMTTLVEFKRKCALVTNYRRGLTDIIDSLYNISTQSLVTLNNATNHTIKQQHAEAFDFAVNLTQAAELGLSDKDVNDSMDAVSSDEEVASAISLIELRNATNYKKVQTAVGVVYRDWVASMENVFNCTSLECNGFEDCLEDFVDNWLYLYQGVTLPGAFRFRRKLAILGKEVKSLVALEDLSVSEAAERSSRILQILQDIKDKNIFCAVAPNITTHPVAMKDMKIGESLELACEATGDPAPTYRWRKNGVLLPGSNAKNLRIEKVTTNDSGNYTCEAYNHVSVESSTPSYIFVHSPPALVYEPPRKLNIPINTGFYLRCNATSSARPLRYQWLFMPFSGDTYSLVPKGNYSVLKFESVQKHEEGVYKCNVSNPFDYTLSHGIQVRILGFSLVVPSLGLSFEMVGDNKRLHDSYEKNTKDNIAGTPLHLNEHFQLDVQLTFTKAVYNVANLSSNAVQNLTVNDCNNKDEINNITCRVSFRLRSLNVTGPESMNRTERENAFSVMESVNVLKRSVEVLFNESAAKGISLNIKDVSLFIDSTSWRTGDYRSICPIGTTLHENNFVCVNCPPGTRGDVNGTVLTCFPCPIGTYQPNQGQTSCIPCPSGFNSRSTGLENLSSCEMTITSPPSQTTQISRSTTETTPNGEIEKKSTKRPDALSVGSDQDVAAKWKLALGVCAAIVVILLVGVLGYVIYYRIKKIRIFKTVEKGKTGNIQSYQNPIYDVNEDVKPVALHRHENPVYQSEDPPTVNEAVKKGSLYSHDNPVYQLEDLPEDDTSL